MDPQHERSYPNPASAESPKTRREFLSQLLIEKHGITPALADYHVSAMTDTRVLEEIQHRSGMELSAAAQTKAGEVFPTGVLISRDDDGTAALNPLSESTEYWTWIDQQLDQQACSVMPDSEREQPRSASPRRRGSFAPSEKGVGFWT